MAMSGASPNHSPKPVAPSPWSQIVAPPSSPSPPVDSAVVNSTPVEDVDTGNVNTGKRPAWNKPSNGASSSVMGADSWPALGESARAPAKSPSPSPPELAKAASLQAPLQGTGTVVPPQRHTRDNAGANNNINTVQTHQKSFKRNSNMASNGGHMSPQISVPQGSLIAAESHNYSPSLKSHQPRAGFVSNDHPQPRNFRHRNGGGLHQRGDGHHHQRGDGHHHSYGGRRDQDRNHDWNNHRSFNSRDSYMAPRFGPRFIRPPPPPNPAQLYPPPPPMRPYGSMGFPELPHQMVYIPPPPLEPMRGVPFVAPIPPNTMYFPPPEAQLHARIVKQIDYYFSNENLIKDTYLRQRMDDQGWVSTSVIAGFKKVQDMTDNVQVVLDALRTSSVVEVQGDKIRRRNDWSRWIMPPDHPSYTGSQPIGQLAAQVQSLSLETTDNINNTGVLDVSQNRPFGDLNGQYMLSTSEGTGQVGIQVSDHSISARN